MAEHWILNSTHTHTNTRQDKTIVYTERESYEGVVVCGGVWRRVEVV